MKKKPSQPPPPPTVDPATITQVPSTPNPNRRQASLLPAMFGREGISYFREITQLIQINPTTLSLYDPTAKISDHTFLVFYPTILVFYPTIRGEIPLFYYYIIIPLLLPQENSSRVEGLVRLTRLTRVASFLVRNIFFVTKSDFFQYLICIIFFQNLNLTRTESRTIQFVEVHSNSDGPGPTCNQRQIQTHSSTSLSPPHHCHHST